MAHSHRRNPKRGDKGPEAESNEEGGTEEVANEEEYDLKTFLGDTKKIFMDCQKDTELAKSLGLCPSYVKNITNAKALLLIRRTSKYVGLSVRTRLDMIKVASMKSQPSLTTELEKFGDTENEGSKKSGESDIPLLQYRLFQKVCKANRVGIGNGIQHGSLAFECIGILRGWLLSKNLKEELMVFLKLNVSTKKKYTGYQLIDMALKKAPLKELPTTLKERITAIIGPYESADLNKELQKMHVDSPEVTDALGFDLVGKNLSNLEDKSNIWKRLWWLDVVFELEYPPIVNEFTSVDDFKGLRQEIGEGSFSKVFSDFSNNPGARKYALKRMSTEAIDSWDWPKQKEIDERFEMEVECLKKLSYHPNVVDYYGSFRDEEGMAYIVMEYIQKPLHVTIEERTDDISPRECASIFQGVLQAVAACHRHDIIHRDVNPRNILYCPEKEKVKLADFSEACDGANGGSHHTMVGTLPYIAPQALSKDATATYTKAFDLYSLGVLLYFMLYKEFPFAVDIDECTRTPELSNVEFGRPNDDIPECLIKGLLADEEKDRFSIQQVHKDKWYKKFSAL